jgi:hypothetical protein
LIGWEPKTAKAQAANIQSIETLFLINALEAPSTITDSQKERLTAFSGIIIGAVLVLVGAVGLHWCPSVLGQRLSEALFISGVLTIVVDPFLKKRLLHEASTDIFHHLIGFDLPLPIRDRLRDIVLKTNLYRKDMVIRCSFTETEGRVHIDFETSYEVMNPTRKVLKFPQHLDFEKAENARLKRIFCDQAKRGYGEGATLALKEGTGLFEYESKEIKIEPNQDTGKRYRFEADFSVDGFPMPGFYTQMFKYPTIGLTVRVTNRPPWLRVTCDVGPNKGDQWNTESLFMPGDHFSLRWESNPLATDS